MTILLPHPPRKLGVISRLALQSLRLYNGRPTKPSLVAFDGGEAYQYFGDAVAMDNDHCCVGAYNATQPNLNNTGAVYCYMRTQDGRWEATSQLVPNGANATGGDFGTALSMHNDTLLVGQNKQKAYVYVFGMRMRRAGSYKRF